MNPADKDLRLRYLETEQIYRLNLFVIVTGGGRLMGFPQSLFTALNFICSFLFQLINNQAGDRRSCWEASTSVTRCDDQHRRFSSPDLRL